MQSLTKVFVRWLLTVSCGVCATLAAIPSPSAAAGSGEEVIYSDLGKQGNCPDREAWSEFGKLTQAGPEAVAFGFVPKQSYNATSIKLALYYYSKFGPGHTFQVMLVNNASYYGENAPENVHLKGTVLARQVTHRANQFFGGCKLQTITFQQGAPLIANNIYWVVILASPDTHGAWYATFENGYKHSMESNSENEGRNWSSAQQYEHPAAFAVYGTPAGN